MVSFGCFGIPPDGAIYRGIDDGMLVGVLLFELLVWVGLLEALVAEVAVESCCVIIPFGSQLEVEDWAVVVTLLDAALVTDGLA